MASDHMHGMPAAQLLAWILKDLEQGSALGLVKDLFFNPQADDPFRMTRYGSVLESPLGVAAGPHTQMAQNIIAAWLTGARYIELKTVQVFDQIQVTKPCIDLNDEGYNCEWSQELSLNQSYEEYLKAWVLLHVLHHKLWGGSKPGFLFNMSAGYSLEGILSPTMQRFMDRMQDCAADVARLKRELEPLYPPIRDLDIPGCMSDSLTISCMHGCPPQEVEKIALYFLEQRKLNTTLKLNPTLLGPKCVRGILNKNLGYVTEIPDLAFEHDLPYDEALRIIRSCRASADKLGLAFSVKLTNTLESVNSHQNLPDNETMVYMSGRALHPISIALAARLQKDFDGSLDMTFCAGLDALNVADTLACGLEPLTVCSDLLKPGGYGRLAQYIENLRLAMREAGASSIDEYITARAGLAERRAAVQKNLDEYALAVTAETSHYSKKAGGSPNVKTARPLPVLDCAAAPCMSVCPAGQDIPAYLGRAAEGRLDKALRIILQTNPFPNLLGKMCNQACRSKCMRSHYDEALRIRDVKACAAECTANAAPEAAPKNGRKVAIAGAGPAGLACAAFLARAGCAVTVFDASDKPGGPLLAKMSREAEKIDRDIQAIQALGVELQLNRKLDKTMLVGLLEEHDALYLENPEQAWNDSPKLFLGHAGENAGKNAPSLVQCVGEGRRAAESILAALDIIAPARRPRFGLDIDALRRKQAFKVIKVKDKIDSSNVQAEAGRCLQCSSYCGICVSACPNRANILLRAAPLSWPVQIAARAGDGVRVITIAEKKLEQSWQVLNLGDFCNECGNCAAFCPSSGAPYRDKQRIHISAASFDADDNGFILDSPDAMRGKSRGKPWSLRREGGNLVYRDQDMTALLSADNLAAVDVQLADGCDSTSLATAVQAAIFFRLLESRSVFGGNVLSTD